MNTRMERLQWWCQQVIPLVYDNSLSYYELLCKVINYINDLIANNNTIKDILAEHGMQIKDLEGDVVFLKTEMEKVKNGDYLSLYLDSLINWIDNNLQCLVSRIVKFVSFSLTDDGYFKACIPETWEFLQFDTGMEQTNDAYGHLILRW